MGDPINKQFSTQNKIKNYICIIMSKNEKVYKKLIDINCALLISIIIIINILFIYFNTEKTADLSIEYIDHVVMEVQNTTAPVGTARTRI